VRRFTLPDLANCFAAMVSTAGDAPEEADSTSFVIRGTSSARQSGPEAQGHAKRLPARHLFGQLLIVAFSGD